jgi:hypothetical protein
MIKKTVFISLLAIFLKTFIPISGFANSAQILEIKDESFIEYSKEELRSLEKWKQRPLVQLVIDALEGDPAALYIIGLGYKYGEAGLPQSTQIANKYFAISASLGFPPAIDKIKTVYLEDDSNPLLALVYTNLEISFGHEELTSLYQEQKALLEKKFGSHAIKEVEKIAETKKHAILDQREKIKKSTNKTNEMVVLLKTLGVVAEDKILGPEHWK